ncbi:MAG: amidase, Asp-tRNAAsn/Glu-tRNAGln amidotransferase subunit [Ilumatobacteraceae bacterium]|nr:amidase, Asp-tRNAAsn/Glu-tRNAGln amidotransferase subunit [Ilumatobacteraceae bacterium]
MPIDPFAPATELAAAIRRRDISSRELLDCYLERIERLDGQVNAVVTLDVDRARAAADDADRATIAGEVDAAARPLHGLPITIKDAIATSGIRSTGGAVELTDHTPDEDAPVVAKLKQAGAIVFGKTNLPRWSGDVQSYNEIFGQTNNPHDLSRVPGGSSGGAAAAVASGFTSFEIGTDIGGSVRIPSHFCGVFGLKPSFGVVPQRGYLDRVGGGITDADINVFGPIARSAADLELLMSVIVGPPPELEPAFRIELPKSTVSSLAGLRVGVWFDEPTAPIDHEYRAILMRTVADLTANGATIIDEHPAVDFTEQGTLFMRMVTEAMLRAMPATAQAGSVTHLAWLDMEDARVAARRRWADYFASVDVMLCPVTPTAAFPHQRGNLAEMTTVVNGQTVPYLVHVGWTGLVGVAGLPSAVAPIGRTAGGLPVGVQVVSPYLHDLRSVAVAGMIGTYLPPQLAV